jgi:ubiquitin-protein ligase
MAAKSAKVFGKELKALFGEKFSDGQVQVIPHNSKDLTVYVILDPKDSPHTGHRYVFAMQFDEYPGKPHVYCLTPVWHPNGSALSTLS